MKTSPGFILVLLILFFSLRGFSQVPAASRNYNAVLSNTGQFGLTFGPAIYHGDLNVGNFTFKRSTGLAASIFGQYYFSNIFGFRVSLYSGILNGGIKSYVKNGAPVEDSFTGIILEGDLHILLNFSNLFFGQSEKRRFFVYGIAGLGYAGWYSKLNNKVYNYDSLATDNPLSNFHASFVIPAGLGFYYRIGNRLNLGLEYSYRTYLSDKIDNTSGGYPYDAVHYVALNISFNLGTGQARERGNRPLKSTQLQPSDYPAFYTGHEAVHPSPPETRHTEQAMPVTETTSAGNQEVILPPRLIVPPRASPKASEAVWYSVQIFAVEHHKYTAGWIKNHYHIAGEVRVETIGKTERFIVGKCADIECARALKKKMQEKGIHDAFIVVYRNGRRNYCMK